MDDNPIPIESSGSDRNNPSRDENPKSDRNPEKYLDLPAFCSKLKFPEKVDFRSYHTNP